MWIPFKSIGAVWFGLFLSVIPCFSFAEKLTFATQDFPPFQTVGDEIGGPLVDIVQQTCMLINIDCEIKAFPWRRAILFAETGRIHGLFAIGRNPQREVWLDFSVPILRSEYGFFTHRATGIETINDLVNKSVGVYGPSNTSWALQQSLSAIVNPRVELFPDDDEIFKMLEYRRLAAAYSNRHVGMSLIQNLGLDHVQYTLPDRPVEYYIGLVKNATTQEQRDRFNAALHLLVSQGIVNRILEKYAIFDAYVDTCGQVAATETTVPTTEIDC